MTTPADFVELRRIVDLYGIAIDRRDAATLCGLFMPEGRIEVYQDEATKPTVVIAGHAEIGAIVEALAVYRRTFHFIGNFVCDVDANSGTGVTYCLANHWLDEGGVSESETLLLTYDDVFERTEGGWRFATRSIRRSWAEFRAVEERLLAIDRKFTA